MRGPGFLQFHSENPGFALFFSEYPGISLVHKLWKKEDEAGKIKQVYCIPAAQFEKHGIFTIKKSRISNPTTGLFLPKICNFIIRSGYYFAGEP